MARKYGFSEAQLQALAMTGDYPIPDRVAQRTRAREAVIEAARAFLAGWDMQDAPQLYVADLRDALTALDEAERGPG